MIFPDQQPLGQRYQGDPLRGSQRSLIDNSRESTSFALLDNQGEGKRYAGRVEESQQQKSNGVTGQGQGWFFEKFLKINN